MRNLTFGWDLPPGCTQRDCDGGRTPAWECHVCGNDVDDCDGEPLREDEDGPLCSEHADWVYDPLGMGYHMDTWVYVCECGRFIDETMSYDDPTGGQDFYECDICGRKQPAPPRGKPVPPKEKPVPGKAEVQGG